MRYPVRIYKQGPRYMAACPWLNEFILGDSVAQVAQSVEDQLIGLTLEGEYELEIDEKENTDLRVIWWPVL